MIENSQLTLDGLSLGCVVVFNKIIVVIVFTAFI